MSSPRSLSTALLGRAFVHPVFDYALVGGALSLATTAVLLSQPPQRRFFDPAAMQYLILFSNSAHFAASTVRLYTKPGAVATQPFVSRVLPGIALVLMTLCVVFAGRVGKLVETIYLTWSPYHYSAQAYGLAVVYSYRSGCRIDPMHKKMLWWAAMMPSLYMALYLLWDRLPEPIRALAPGLAAPLSVTRSALVVAGVVAPILLFARVWRSPSGPMPFISLLTLLSNAVWFFVLDPIDAFVWATVFHGVQYLAIVMIFDIKDQMARPGNRHGSLFHALWFYGMSVALGYALFILLPVAYRALGFDYYDGKLTSIAFVNIHHFIVDAYIWRLGASDSNRKIIEAPA